METQQEPLNLPTHLYHFTKLSYLLHILHTKKLTLTNPAKWDDENDKCSIKRYKKLRNITTLLALCFTEKKESYHFWKIHGTEGVRIEFNAVELKRVLKNPKITFGEADYKSLDVLKEEIANPNSNIKTKLPFLKREHGYSYECEWRAIYESDEVEETKEMYIGDDLSTIIKEIALSPWLCDEVLPSITEVLKEKLKPIKGDIKIGRSGVCKHKDWIQIINNITNTT